MDKLPYTLEVWTLNQTYNKIKNCRVVEPSYEIDGSYSNEFFLDKRFWLELVFQDINKKFLDYIDVKWIRYYLYREWSKHYLGTYNGTFNVITTGWFTVDNNSPLQIATGRGGYGPSTWSLTIDVAPTMENANDPWFTDIPGYSGWYVKFHYSWETPIVEWNYINFTSGILKWGTNKVMKVSAWYIYIIGTNARGSLPKVWDTFEVFSSIWTTLLIGHATWVSMAVLNGHNPAKLVDVLTTTEPIIDVLNFDGSIFAMTETHVYFSRAKFDDNTQFYPLDNFPVDWGYKLFPIGKAMLVFARQNKLIAAANATGTTLWYVMYDANYNGDLYSKYSLIFADQTIYLFQDDKQLMQVDLVQNNNTSFNVVTKNILTQNRGKFSSLSWWEVRINISDRYLNFLYINGNDTTNIQYDKQYTHWIDNEYIWKKIYKYWTWNWILSDSAIYSEWWYDDDGTAYKQEVNFSINGNDQIWMPYLLRTLFWMLPNWLIDTEEPRWDFDVNLTISTDLGWKMTSLEKTLKNFKFDTRLNATPTGDELVGFDDTLNEWADYTWNCVSIQTPIYKTWRYIYFKYTSFNRFIIGHSYIFVEKTKPFINEIDLNN